MARPLDDAALEQAALAYLGRYAASTETLRRVLMRKVERAARQGLAERDVATRAVAALVERFRRAGLVDDAAFAENRTVTLRRRGASASAVRGHLAAKGIKRDLADEALLRAGGAGGPAELAAAAAFARRRRLGPFRIDGRPERRRHDLAALGRAGFDPDVARRVIDAASPEDIEALIGEDHHE
jgi:regulatory protein